MGATGSYTCTARHSSDISALLLDLLETVRSYCFLDQQAYVCLLLVKRHEVVHGCIVPCRPDSTIQ